MKTLSVFLLLVRQCPGGVIRRAENDKNFSEEELQQFHEIFLSLYPDGKVTVERITKAFKKCFPFWDSSKFATLAFNWYDENKDGCADCKELFHLMSVLADGTAEEKFYLVFKLFDQDSDGSITRDEQHDFYDSIFYLLDNGINRPEDNAVKKVLDHFDKNLDGKISFEEFKLDIEVSAEIMHLQTFYNGIGDYIAQNAQNCGQIYVEGTLLAL